MLRGMKRKTTIRCEKQANGKQECCVYPQGQTRGEPTRCFVPKRRKGK